MSDDFVVDDPVDPYAGDTESVLDEDTGEELPPYLADDPLATDTPDDEAPGVVAVEPDPSDMEEDLEPLPESWAELDPEAVDLPDADESEATIADEVDSLDDYDPLEITPDADEPEPEPVRWDAYEIQAREAGTISDFFQIALTDDPDAASVAVTTLEPGKTYEIRLRGIKADGTTSGWSETETVVLPVDQIPPPQPSAPVVVGVPGGVVISHDGLTSTGEPQPTDYAQTVLWVQKGTAAPYIIDRFTGAFNVTYNSLDITPMAWWVTTVDQAGNSSVKSAEVNGQAQELIDEAGLRDKLDRLSTGEALVADSVAAYIGEYLHLKAAQLDANEIWSNSAWLGQAKFTDVSGGYETLVDGKGLRVWQQPEDPEHDPVPVITLGAGGENSFATYGDGVFLGGIGADGSITGTSVSSEEDITVAGKDLLGDLTEYEIPGQDNSSILSPMPRGLVARGYRNMSGTSFSTPTHLAFLEVAFEAKWRRAYRVNIDPYGMNTSKTYYQRVMVTYDGSSPDWSTYSTSFTNSIRNGVGGGGVFYLQPTNTGVTRVLVGVYSGTAGITFGGTGISQVRVWVEDIGSRVEDTGINRAATIVPTSGGGSSEDKDPAPVKKSYFSAWRPSWMRSFYNGGSSQQVTGKGSTMLKQGYDRYWAAGGIQTSVMGGFTGNAVAGEKTKTISQALSGATIDSGSIELKAEYVPGGGSATVRLHWHTHSSAPSSYTSTANHIGDYSIKQGASRRIDLPSAALTAIKNGTFGGFGLTPRGSTSNTYNMGISWATRPTLRLSYHR